MNLPDGLSRLDLGADTNLLADLVKVFSARRRMNLRRSRFYDGESGLRDFGISIPPQMLGMKAALGWSAKGVHAVTDRSVWLRFVLARGGSDDPFDLAGVLEQNQFEHEFEATRVSSAMHGCAFTTVTDGDVLSGEPDVLIMGRAAEDSAAIWDRRRRALKGFLSVVASKDGQPVELIFYTFETIYEIKKVRGRWQAIARPHRLGEVPAVAHPYGFELRRPLGHSRITKPSMYFIDGAIRTVARSEVSAELYSMVQLFLFGEGVSELFDGDRWSAATDMIKSLDLNPGETPPQLHRFSGQSPQPHVDQLRMFANLFADDQSLEVKFADSSNPASADAIFAEKESLITLTGRVNRTWGYGAAKVAQLTVRLRDQLGSTVSDELRSLRSEFENPAIVSPSARAAAFTQLAGAIDGFADTEVGQEFGGLSPGQISRLQSQLDRARSASTMQQLLAADQVGAEDTEDRELVTPPIQ